MKIRIDIPLQRMELMDRDGTVIRRYAVSTAALGVGEQAGSHKTPRGLHVVRAKIGGGMPCGTVFRGRRPTGEIWDAAVHDREPSRDWILSRILWLSGCEPGRNRQGSVDTMRRYIYIHGTPDCEPMGIPASHGCIRMRNRDVMELFDLVSAGTHVMVETRNDV